MSDTSVEKKGPPSPSPVAPPSLVKVLLSNLPAEVEVSQIEAFLEPHGTFEVVAKSENHHQNGTPPTANATVTYKTREEAESVVKAINDTEFEGSKISARILSDHRRSPKRVLGQGRPIDFPLRVLVQSEMVGAIIGRGGQTIRQITQQTRARVDVHRKENMGSLEKAITIYGQPENCTNACHQILIVMQEEAKNTGKPEDIPLKVLAHNNLIGRIIGKQGATIKKIMEDTDTKITVSSINDINSFNMERVITIKGSIDNISRAEAEVSAKLRVAYESDLQAMSPQSVMFPGLHPAAMMSTVGIGINYPPGGPPANQRSYGQQGGAMYPNGGAPQGSQGAPRPAVSVPWETTFLYIPNAAVGAVIGTKGSHIRNIIKFSGATVKIAPLENEGAEQQVTERKVTVEGSPESQWKAQYLIFEKLREEGFAVGMDDVRLTVEVLVPSSQVGRIIGKGGANVREMQRLTGAVLKLPEQGSAMGEETPVHITGTFYSVQSAQRRLRSMIQPPMAAGHPPYPNGGSNEGAAVEPTEVIQPQA